MRFYGLGYLELMALNSHVVEDLWQAISVLESQEGLVNRTASLWSKLKDSVRRKEHRELWKKAYPKELYPRPSISFKEFLGKFQGG